MAQKKQAQAKKTAARTVKAKKAPAKTASRARKAVSKPATKKATAKKPTTKTTAAKKTVKTKSAKTAAKTRTTATATKARAAAKSRKPAASSKKAVASKVAKKPASKAATAKATARAATGKATVAKATKSQIKTKSATTAKSKSATDARKAAVAAAAKKLAAQRAKPQRAVPASVGRSAVAKKTSAPVKTPASPKAIAAKTVANRQALSAQKKPVSQRHGFKTNEFVVYPAHGVGRIIGIEEQEIAGIALELFVINFEKEKLTLRVPTGKLESVGMRKLADEGIVTKAMTTLKGRARVKRTMWSRRAQEYIAKINSGDLISIAEVVRDLYRSDTQPEQSYSERQLYEDALDRMAREIAAVEKLDERGAVQRITDVLSKSARNRQSAEEAAASKAA